MAHSVRKSFLRTRLSNQNIRCIERCRTRLAGKSQVVQLEQGLDRIIFIRDSWMRSYSTSEVAKLTGLTLRQLQYFHERGIIKPVIICHRRQYSPAQLREARRLAQIRRDYRIKFTTLLPLLSSGMPIRIISVPTVIGATLIIPATYKKQQKQQ